MFPKAKICCMVCVIVSIVALVILNHSSALEILDCGPDAPLVVEEAFSNIQVICISIKLGFENLWYLNWTENSRSIHKKAVHCLWDVKCTPILPYTGIMKYPDTAALNLTDFIRVHNLTGITCTERHPYTGKEDSYTCNIRIISAPKISCRLHVSISNAIVEGHCNVRNIHFRKRQYSCIWYQLEMTSGERTLIAQTYVANYTEDGSHVSGTCTTLLPRPTGGKFTYEILLLPEGLRARVS